MGDTIVSGRNPRHGNKDQSGHAAHLLSATQSEERVLSTGAYATGGQSGVRRVKMRQVPGGLG